MEVIALANGAERPGIKSYLETGQAGGSHVLEQALVADGSAGCPCEKGHPCRVAQHRVSVVPMQSGRSLTRIGTPVI